MFLVQNLVEVLSDENYNNIKVAKGVDLIPINVKNLFGISP